MMKLQIVLSDGVHIFGQYKFLKTVRENKLVLLSEKPNKMQQCIKILLFLILNAYATWQRPTTARPTTFHACKTRGCLCSFRLLMMGGVSPETCWASFKIRNNKVLIHCCILLGFSLRIVLWCTDQRTWRINHFFNKWDSVVMYSGNQHQIRVIKFNYISHTNNLCYLHAHS